MEREVDRRWKIVGGRTFGDADPDDVGCCAAPETGLEKRLEGENAGEENGVTGSRGRKQGALLF